MGCTNVSPACDHCYAETLVTGRMGLPVWGQDADRRVTSENYWKEPLRWNRKARETGEFWPVFCGSLCDVMETRAGEVGAKMDAARLRLYDLIDKTPFLTWLLLTKRPQNFRKLIPPGWLECPILNVWGMTTVESPKYLWRIDDLKGTPFVKHGLSIEPLLEDMPTIGEHLDGIDWVLVGGESGAGARPMHPDWPRRIRDECLRLDIAYHFKQWGEWGPSPILDRGDAFGLRNVGKKAAGCLLDGREWKEFPR
jgi:protein gp37